ncbi:hypothetical protein FIBSPDRAFT_1011607 [Athelia psychrophila]|uniref:Uncharacterized protein n=1 Tax=Athelia psychrophila TaxID=1759441 RepID=A0A166MWF2_9AGAM|nr:hypothetical protein FIBSPDRAFT_1011607 [Fibularhizoctonia sp. CBS 109695]
MDIPRNQHPDTGRVSSHRGTHEPRYHAHPASPLLRHPGVPRPHLSLHKSPTSLPHAIGSHCRRPRQGLPSLRRHHPCPAPSWPVRYGVRFETWLCGQGVYAMYAPILIRLWKRSLCADEISARAVRALREKSLGTRRMM